MVHFRQVLQEIGGLKLLFAVSVQTILSPPEAHLCTPARAVTTHRPSHAPEPHLPGGGHSPKGATAHPRFPCKEVTPVTIQPSTKRISKLLAIKKKKNQKQLAKEQDNG